MVKTNSQIHEKLTHAIYLVKQLKKWFSIKKKEQSWSKTCHKSKIEKAIINLDLWSKLHQKVFFHLLWSDISKAEIIMWKLNECMKSANFFCAFWHPSRFYVMLIGRVWVIEWLNVDFQKLQITPFIVFCDARAHIILNLVWIGACATFKVRLSPLEYT